MTFKHKHLIFILGCAFVFGCNSETKESNSAFETVTVKPHDSGFYELVDLIENEDNNTYCPNSVYSEFQFESYKIRIALDTTGRDQKTGNVGSLYLTVSDTNCNIVDSSILVEQFIGDFPIRPNVFQSALHKEVIIAVVESAEYGEIETTYFLFKNGKLTRMGSTQFMSSSEDHWLTSFTRISREEEVIHITFDSSVYVDYDGDYFNVEAKDVRLEYALNDKNFVIYYKNNPVDELLVSVLPSEINSTDDAYFQNVTLLESTTGDLNNDGIEDLVFAVQEQHLHKLKIEERKYSPPDTIDINSRILAVYLGKESGGYSKLVQKADFLPLKDNPYLAEPVDEFIIDSTGELELTFSYFMTAGSYGTSNEKYTFRMVEGDLCLLRTEDFYMSRNSGTSSLETIDYEIGVYRMLKENEFYSEEEEPQDFSDSTDVFQVRPLTKLQDLEVRTENE